MKKYIFQKKILTLFKRFQTLTQMMTMRKKNHTNYDLKITHVNNFVINIKGKSNETNN